MVVSLFVSLLSLGISFPIRLSICFLISLFSLIVYMFVSYHLSARRSVQLLSHPLCFSDCLSLGIRPPQVLLTFVSRGNGVVTEIDSGEKRVCVTAPIRTDSICQH